MQKYAESSRVLEIKSARSKFAKGARVIVESAERNLSARGQVTGVGSGFRSRARSRTDLGHTSTARARETSDLVLRSTMSSHRRRRRLLRISRSPGGSSLAHTYTRCAILRSASSFLTFLGSPMALSAGASDNARCEIRARP